MFMGLIERHYDDAGELIVMKRMPDGRIVRVEAGTTAERLLRAVSDSFDVESRRMHERVVRRNHKFKES